jgi:hypothetical protein
MQEVKLIIVDGLTHKYNGFNLTADIISMSVECERGVKCSEALSGANYKTESILSTCADRILLCYYRT